MVRRKRVGRVLVIATLLLSLLSCGGEEPAVEGGETAEVEVDARVFELEVSRTPEGKRWEQTIAVAGPLVRIGEDVDVWRLFDLEARTVTIIDDVARTYRVDSLDALLARRRQLLRNSLPPHIPRASLVETGTVSRIGDVPARLHVITLGAYRRELWLSVEPLIAPDFFRMFIATEPLAAPYAGVMRGPQERLLELEGFPVLDRTLMPVADENLVIEKKLERVTERKVPESWFRIPAGYEELEAATGPAVDRRSAS